MAGKTRAAVEAMRSQMRAWRLLIPHGAASLTRLVELHLPLRHTVVWLDEIHTILLDPVGVEAIRRLLGQPDGPLVLLGTLRADREALLKGSAGWDVLDRRAHLIALKRRPPRAELAHELARARELDDPWIVDALSRIGSRYGIAEWLAAGPQLLRALQRARTSSGLVERVAAAVVDAAIDCYRAGYTTPCPEPLLRQAHQLYLDDPTTPTSDTVFGAALDWARDPVAGAVGLLEHRRGRGDLAFDYLLGHAARPTASPPDPGIWPVLLDHLTMRTAAAIALAAHHHEQPHITATLHPRLHPAVQTELLTAQGDTEALTARADAGDEHAANLLAGLLDERGDVAGLTARADAGDEHAARRLAALLGERRDVTRLTARADAGDVYASLRLAGLLGERGDVAGLAARAHTGDEHAAYLLAGPLGQRGDVAGLTTRADAGDEHAAARLAGVLVERGDVPGLTARAHAGDRYAAGRLAELLAERGDVAALTTRADAGDEHAARRLAWVLAERGDVAGLTTRAGDRYPGRPGRRARPRRRSTSTGSSVAAGRLAELLAERGDVAALTARANARDEHAARRLAGLLGERGDVAGLSARANAGDEHAARRLAGLLGERGDVAGLSARADAGDEDAARRLAGLLGERGDVAGLSARADAGDKHAAVELSYLRVVRGMRPGGEE